MPASTTIQLNVEDPRIRRYRLLDAARELLPGNQRLQECHRANIPSTSVQLWRHNNTHRSHFQNLLQCGEVWTCPVCSTKISERRRNELQPALDAYPNGLAMATLTLQHNTHTPLAKVLTALKTAWRSMHSGRLWQDFTAHYGIIGAVTSTEITWSARAGWHPHLHCILFFDRPRATLDIDAIETNLSTLWIREVAKTGAWALAPYAVHLERAASTAADYVTKWGPDYTNDTTAQTLADRTLSSTWTAADELTRQVSKRSAHGMNPWQLLDAYLDGNKQAAALFVEYSTVMQGQHQLQWSRGLRATLGLGKQATDAAIVQKAEDNCTLLYTFTTDEWHAILANDCRAILLQAAETLDADSLENLIKSLAA